MIDDVWSGGKAIDGPYMLLSSAMQDGLYHPNCKDSHSTYFPILDDNPEARFSRRELNGIKEDYRNIQGYLKTHWVVKMQIVIEKSQRMEK